MAIGNSKLEICWLQFAQNCMCQSHTATQLFKLLPLYALLFFKKKYHRPNESSLCIEGAAVGICQCMSQTFLLIISFEKVQIFLFKL